MTYTPLDETEQKLERDSRWYAGGFSHSVTPINHQPDSLTKVTSGSGAVSTSLNGMEHTVSASGDSAESRVATTTGGRGNLSASLKDRCSLEIIFVLTGSNTPTGGICEVGFHSPLGTSAGMDLRLNLHNEEVWSAGNKIGTLSESLTKQIPVYARFDNHGNGSDVWVRQDSGHSDHFEGGSSQNIFSPQSDHSCVYMEHDGTDPGQVVLCGYKYTPSRDAPYQ